MIYIHTLGIQCNTILWLGCHVKWSDTLSFCLCVDQILNEHKHEHNISDTLSSTQQKSNLNIIQLMISDHYFRPNRKLFQMKLGWKLLCGAETIRTRLFFIPQNRWMSASTAITIMWMSHAFIFDCRHVFVISYIVFRG